MPGTAQRGLLSAARRTCTALAVLWAAGLLGGCGGVSVKPTDTVPVPLVEPLPLRVGVYYSPEFRSYVSREERWGTKWEVTLGAAHVTQIDRLAKAMFAATVPVTDLARPPEPALAMIIEPRFEEFAFVTPRDAGAPLYAVTIKYRINIYDGAARLIDSLVYTGYGNEAAGSLSSSTPLAVATSKAMRDAGAKFATEFPEQPVVRKLVGGEPVEPLPVAAPAAGATGGAIAEVSMPAGPPPVAKTPPAAGAAPGAAAVAPTPAAGAEADGAAPLAVPATTQAEPPAGTTAAPSAAPVDASAPASRPAAVEPTRAPGDAAQPAAGKGT